MDLSALLIAVLAALLAAHFVTRPLRGRAADGGLPSGEESARLRADLEETLARLEEIESDREAAVLSEEEYAAERPRLLRQAAELMRQLEAVDVEAGSRPTAGSGSAGGSAEVDREDEDGVP